MFAEYRWFSDKHTYKKTEEQRYGTNGALSFRGGRFNCSRREKHMKEKIKNLFTTKRLCRAGVIAALYVALTYAFGAIAYSGFIEIRPAEALTVLPLFFPEAVPALWIGCMLANLASPFIIYDVPIGGAATLIAALLTYAVGRVFKNHALRMGAGGIFPVIVNALLIPVIIVFLCPGGSEGFATAQAAYFTYFASLCATQALWVYGLGIPLYVAVANMQKRGMRVMLNDPPKSTANNE